LRGDVQTRQWKADSVVETAKYANHAKPEWVEINETIYSTGERFRPFNFFPFAYLA